VGLRREVLRARSGRESAVRRRRLRLPAWRPPDYDPWEDASDLFWTAFASLVLAPPSLVLVPLLRFLVELPVALARAALSSDRWVEAACRWPREIPILWRTRKGQERRVAEKVAAQLELGYEHLRPEGAEFAAMTRPPGVDLLGMD